MRQVTDTMVSRQRLGPSVWRLFKDKPKVVVGQTRNHQEVWTSSEHETTSAAETPKENSRRPVAFPKNLNDSLALWSFHVVPVQCSEVAVGLHFNSCSASSCL